MLKDEIKMSTIKKRRSVSWFLLVLGLVALAISVIYASSVLAFIGLGLTFWGLLSLYITNEKYVKQTLLGSTITPSLANLNQMLAELEYRGKGIYLPPKYLKEFDTIKVYIPKGKNTYLPTPQEIQQQEDKTFLKNPEGALINPPGASLSNLFEKTLGKSFTTVDLEYLQLNLPKLFIEDLEIAENLEIQMKDNSIHVRITNSIFKDICKDPQKPFRMYDTIGCPLRSAIACAIAKASGNLVTIEKSHVSEDGEVIEVHYRLIEEKRN